MNLEFNEGPSSILVDNSQVYEGGDSRANLIPDMVLSFTIPTLCESKFFAPLNLFTSSAAKLEMTSYSTSLVIWYARLNGRVDLPLRRKSESFW